MLLNNNHRQCLLNELQKTREEFELGKSLSRNNQAQDYIDWQDIKLFLLEQRIKLIEKSLIDNEIDY